MNVVLLEKSGSSRQALTRHQWMNGEDWGRNGANLETHRPCPNNSRQNDTNYDFFGPCHQGQANTAIACLVLVSLFFSLKLRPSGEVRRAHASEWVSLWLMYNIVAVAAEAAAVAPIPLLKTSKTQHQPMKKRQRSSCGASHQRAVKQANDVYES